LFGYDELGFNFFPLETDRKTQSSKRIRNGFNSLFRSEYENNESSIASLLGSFFSVSLNWIESAFRFDSVAASV
jgi:hypothetical protein